MKISRLLVGLGFITTLAPAALASSFSYDFNNLNSNTPLVGQDGWVKPGLGPYDYSPIVTSGTASNAAVTSDIAYNTSAERPLSSPIHYSSVDTSTVFMLDAYLGQSHPGAFSGTSAMGGPSFDSDPTSGLGLSFYRFGLFAPEGNGVCYASLDAAVPFVGDRLATNTWYQFKLVLDFSPSNSARASLFYRNLSAAQPTFTPDTKIQNITVSLDGTSSTAYGATVLLSGAPGEAYVDNLFFSDSTAVPVPSALSAGLFLIAAWAGRRILSVLN